MTIGFRPLSADDLPLVGEWLEREHVRPWWPPPPEGLAAHYGPALEGREPTDLYLILLGGRPVGLIETYLVADYPEYDAVLHVGPGVAGIDLLLGEPDTIGRGIGPRVIGAFTRERVFASPDVRACVAGVDADNRRSLRAFAKAGFRAVSHYEEEGRPHRLLRLDRPL
jgi:aminoglycoside 6'-N-acetyltransferase